MLSFSSGGDVRCRLRESVVHIYISLDVNRVFGDDRRIDGFGAGPEVDLCFV